MTTCRSCGAKVTWVHTEPGRSMPLDAEPVEGGNVLFTGRQTAINGVYRNEVRVEVPGSQPLFDDGADRYVSHFATCAQSDDWRKA